MGGKGDDWREGVRPLRGRDAARPEPEPQPKPKPAPRRADPDFVQGDDGSGRRADVPAKELARLRRGAWVASREIDLHGLPAAGARRLVRAGLARAGQSGERCVRVVHGRGLHSPEGAALRDALPGWLREAPLAASVMAWARESASRDGATLVLLRRARPGRGR